MTAMKCTKECHAHVELLCSFQTSCFFLLSRSRRCLLNFWVLISQDPHRELRGKNVLIVRGSLQDTARLVDVDEAVLKEQLARAREILFEERKNRPPPHLDTKMITAWNGEHAFVFITELNLFIPRRLKLWRDDLSY